MRVSLDIETGLYGVLENNGYSASAHSIPASLGETLPHVHVTRTGGYTTDIVIESNNIDFDVYAEDEAAAMTAASNLCGFVRELVGTSIGDSPCYSVDVITLPYGNPDPRHPNISRATFKTQILTRVKGAFYA